MGAEWFIITNIDSPLANPPVVSTIDAPSPRPSIGRVVAVVLSNVASKDGVPGNVDPADESSRGRTAPISIHSVNLWQLYMIPYWPLHRNRAESGPMVRRVRGIVTPRNDENASALVSLGGTWSASAVEAEGMEWVRWCRAGRGSEVVEVVGAENSFEDPTRLLVVGEANEL